MNTKRTNTGATSDPVFAHGGEMGTRMRSHDWTTTALGLPASWPQSLRSALSICLGSSFPIAIYWGPTLSLLYNDAWSPILGAKHPWGLGRPAREVWPEIWEAIGPLFDQVQQTGQATYREDELLPMRRHGYTEECYFNYTFSPIRGDSGQVEGIFNAVIETTFRVIAERRTRVLRDLGERITVARSAQQACTIAAEVLGNASKDVPFAALYLVDDGADVATLAASCGILSPPATPREVPLGAAGNGLWPFRHVRATGQVETVTQIDLRVGNETPSGPWPEAPTAAFIAPLRDGATSVPTGFVVLGASARRAIDDEYLQFAERAAAHVSTAIATATAYEAERKRAEALAEIDRAKTAFFSNVSHEFRTPLTLILGPLSDARREADSLPETVREQLELAHRNSSRLLRLVNTLLDFSRIEAGRVRAQFEPTDLCALTRDLASTFRSAMEKAGLEYSVGCDPIGEPVFVDREMWEKVVLNLISNAFKFTLTGAVSVSLSRANDRAVLTVQDTGVGIPAHELPHIFERFHRVEGIGGRSHEGSGIGLALVQELVKLHGGELAVASRVGEGTRFTVSLPLGADHLPVHQIVRDGRATRDSIASAYVEEAVRWLPDADVAGVRTTAAEPLSRTDLSEVSGRILLADDNADMRHYAYRLLSERWQVQTVTNGREALDVARSTRPDVIVTDVMMPELDGFGLLRAIRSDPDLHSIPVILLSARAGEEARLEGLAATADDYLVKPFSARDLMARVDAQLVKARVRAAERRHATRLANLFAQAPVAIAVLRGPDHVYEIANAPYLELIGGRQVLGKPVREVLPELTGQGIYELLDRVWTSREPFVGQSVRVHLNPGPDGAAGDYYFDFVYQPVVDEVGHVDSIVVIAHDVTALAIAKNEAETANRLKDEFLATLSHELRTPLNAVLGYIQMLRGGAIPAERTKTVLETIERNARLQEQLISDVLDVSRIITGQLRIDVQPVDLARVIQDALETVMPAATAKGVRLQPAIDYSGVPVAGDAQRLQQVVWNLLSNAVKFTPRGGRVQVRLARVDSHVEITVSDSGDGIAPEFLPHIFQRFRQADSSLTRAHGGLGLGLAISRHLVEAHGGRIKASSPGKGQGTTVRVELPLMIVHDAQFESSDRAHPAVPSLDATPFSLPDLRGVRVLLVDDDADALQMAKDVLAASAATVVTASGAVEALEALDRERFDVAVLDIGMPDIDGYELLRRIRQRPVDRQGAIPAAALTAYARAADRTRSLTAGFQMHLSKPVDAMELAATILALARRAPGETAGS